MIKKCALLFPNLINHFNAKKGTNGDPDEPALYNYISRAFYSDS